jgi:hypothetical protein
MHGSNSSKLVIQFMATSSFASLSCSVAVTSYPALLFHIKFKISSKKKKQKIYFDRN